MDGGSVRPFLGKLPPRMSSTTPTTITDFDDKDCECGNNREKGFDTNGDMRCEDCDIDGINYNGGLTDEEDEDEHTAQKKKKHVETPEERDARQDRQLAGDGDGVTGGRGGFPLSYAKN